MKPEEATERSLLDLSSDALEPSGGAHRGDEHASITAREIEAEPQGENQATLGEPVDPVVSRVGAVSNSDVRLTGIHNETINYFQTSERGAREDEPSADLTLDHLRPRTVAQILDAANLFEVDEREVAEVERALGRLRFAVISGERGLGKVAFAQVVAARLAAGDSEVRQILHCVSFSRGLRWRPERWFDGRNRFSHSILLFEDLFDGKNLEVGRYFDRFDEAEAGCLADWLAKSDSYLMITAERETLRGRPERLRRSQVLFEMAPPEGLLLIRSMHRRLGLRRLAQIEAEEMEERIAKAQELLESHAEPLAKRLRTFPRAVRFADELLPRVARGELTIESALEGLDDLERWLLTDLPERPLHLSFVLALLLSSTDPRTPWVPWLFLHEVWREVEAILGKELRWDGGDEPRPFGRLVVDDAFLESVRAQAQIHPYPTGESFRFAESTIHGRLWTTLAGPGRALLALLASQMISWSASDSPVLRLVGRYVLGRSGELAPSHYVLPRIDELLSRPGTEQDETRPDPELSQLLAGVATSTDRFYAEGCLDRVFAVVKRTDSRQIGPAFYALSGIAGVMPDPILDRLERHLNGVLDRSPTDPAAVKHRLNALGAEESGRSSESPVRRRGRDGKLAAELEDLLLGSLDDANRERLRGTRYVLVGLCLGERSTEALGRLAAWTERTGSPLAAWMALIALHKNGIFETVEGFPVRVRYENEEGEIATCRVSRLLLALDGRTDREALAHALENAYERSGVFPLRLRRVMRARLLRRFEGWIEQASELPELREVVVALTHRLLEGEGALRGDVFRALRRQGEGGEAAGELALEILRGMLPGRRPDERARA